MLAQVGAKALILVAGAVAGVFLTAATIYFFPTLWLQAIGLPTTDQAGVAAVQLFYEFQGTVTAIEKSESGDTLLVLDISGGSVPRFTVSPDTLFFSLKDNQLKASKLEELEVGAHATLQMHYNLKEKAWGLAVVTFRLPHQ